MVKFRLNAKECTQGAGEQSLPVSCPVLEACLPVTTAVQSSLQVGAFREFMRITRRCAEPVAFSFSAPLHREQVGEAVTLCALLPLAPCS